MTTDDAHTVQTLTDDVLSVAEGLGFVCPPLALGAAAMKTLVDAGFVAYFRSAVLAVNTQRAAQTAGVAAEASQAATTAMERDRGGLKGICRPCFDTVAELMDEVRLR